MRFRIMLLAALLLITNALAAQSYSGRSSQTTGEAEAPPTTQTQSWLSGGTRFKTHELDDKNPIHIGDKLNYVVVEDRENPIILFVAEDGKVNVPLVGRVSASGLTPKQLAEKVSKELEKDYYYQATVRIGQYHDAQSRGKIFVMGQVANPGMLDVPPGEIMTVSKAILYSGGFEDAADASSVYVIRKDPLNPGEEEKINVDVDNILGKGDFDSDITLEANDLVFIPVGEGKTGTFTVSGSVINPGIYEIKPGRPIMLSEAILQAGGVTQFGNSGSVKLVRHNEKGQREEMEIDVDEVLEEGHRDKDVALQADDMIIVPERWISF